MLRNTMLRSLSVRQVFQLCLFRSEERGILVYIVEVE